MIMDEITFTSAQYTLDDDGNNQNIKTVIDGKTWFVPLDPANRHYAEILRQVEAGTLTIAPAEGAE
jgi:hypothetical protein